VHATLTQGLRCETTADNGYRRIQQSSTTLDSGTAYVSRLTYYSHGCISLQTWFACMPTASKVGPNKALGMHIA
jgi:hypothetical protein